MMPSENDIIKFQSLYKERFGIELSSDKAREKGIALLRLFTLTYQPMTVGEFEAVKKRKHDLK